MTLKRHIGDISRAMNRLIGGSNDESLCGRAARKWGTDCLPCRVIGFVLNDPLHCVDELIWSLRQKRRKQDDD